MMQERQLWVVLEETLELFHRHRLREDYFQQTMQEGLALVVHSPALSEEDRVMLCRLADLLHISNEGHWDLYCPRGDLNRPNREIVTVIPLRSCEAWQRCLDNIEETIRIFGHRACMLRSMNSTFPPVTDADPPEAAWLERSNFLMSLHAQDLRLRDVRVMSAPVRECPRADGTAETN